MRRRDDSVPRSVFICKIRRREFFTAGRTGVVMGKIHSRGTRDGGFIIDLLPCECEAFVVLFLKRCHT